MSNFEMGMGMLNVAIMFFFDAVPNQGEMGEGMLNVAIMFFFLFGALIIGLLLFCWLWGRGSKVEDEDKQK